MLLEQTQEPKVLKVHREAYKEHKVQVEPQVLKEPKVPGLEYKVLLEHKVLKDRFLLRDLLLLFQVLKGHKEPQVNKVQQDHLGFKAVKELKGLRELQEVLVDKGPKEVVLREVRVLRVQVEIKEHKDRTELKVPKELKELLPLEVKSNQELRALKGLRVLKALRPILD